MPTGKRIIGQFAQLVLDYMKSQGPEFVLMAEDSSLKCCCEQTGLNASQVVLALKHLLVNRLVIPNNIAHMQTILYRVGGDTGSRANAADSFIVNPNPPSSPVRRLPKKRTSPRAKTTRSVEPRRVFAKKKTEKLAKAAPYVDTPRPIPERRPNADIDASIREYVAMALRIIVEASDGVNDSNWRVTSRIPADLLYDRISNISHAQANRLVAILNSLGLLVVCGKPCGHVHVKQDSTEVSSEALRRAGCNVEPTPNELKRMLADVRATMAGLRCRLSELEAERSSNVRLRLSENQLARVQRIMTLGTLGVF